MRGAAAQGERTDGKEWRGSPRMQLQPLIEWSPSPEEEATEAFVSKAKAKLKSKSRKKARPPHHTLHPPPAPGSSLRHPHVLGSPHGDCSPNAEQ
eukprot:1165533-Prorocentrum_minimum.AAC.1